MGDYFECKQRAVITASFDASADPKALFGRARRASPGLARLRHRGHHRRSTRAVPDHRSCPAVRGPPRSAGNVPHPVVVPANWKNPANVGATTAPGQPRLVAGQRPRRDDGQWYPVSEPRTSRGWPSTARRSGEGLRRRFYVASDAKVAAADASALRFDALIHARMARLPLHAGQRTLLAGARMHRQRRPCA